MYNTFFHLFKDSDPCRRLRSTIIFCGHKCHKTMHFSWLKIKNFAKILSFLSVSSGICRIFVCTIYQPSLPRLSCYVNKAILFILQSCCGGPSHLQNGINKCNRDETCLTTRNTQRPEYLRCGRDQKKSPSIIPFPSLPPREDWWGKN